MKVVSSASVPRVVPIIQMHPDCDPQGLWCTPKLRMETNLWLLQFFGVRSAAFTVGNTMFMHPDLYQEMMYQLQDWKGDYDILAGGPTGLDPILRLKT